MPSVHLAKSMAYKTIDLDDKQEINRFLKEVDFIITDCDGVLWLDNNVIPGSPQALNKLREKGKNIIFVTNNDTKTRDEFCDKLRKLGFEANVNELYPASYLIAHYLKSQNFNRKVYILGSSGIADELNKVGIRSIGVGADQKPEQLPGISEFDEEVGAVAVGMEYDLSFSKSVKACTYIKNRNCSFIASNYDEKMPNPEMTVPGPGAILALIESATGKKAVTLGKPSTLFFDIIKKDFPNIDPQRCVMIGDRLTTDVVFGRNNNMKTLFVETGVNSYNDMIKFANSQQAKDRIYVPDYYLKALNDLNKYL